MPFCFWSMLSLTGPVIEDQQNRQAALQANTCQPCSERLFAGCRGQNMLNNNLIRKMHLF